MRALPPRRSRWLAPAMTLLLAAALLSCGGGEDEVDNGGEPAVRAVAAQYLRAVAGSEESVCRLLSEGARDRLALEADDDADCESVIAAQSKQLSDRDLEVFNAPALRAAADAIDRAEVRISDQSAIVVLPEEFVDEIDTTTLDLIFENGEWKVDSD